MLSLMVCNPCSEGKHQQCPAVKKKQKTLCDCQHHGQRAVIPPPPKDVSE